MSKVLMIALGAVSLVCMANTCSSAGPSPARSGTIPQDAAGWSIQYSPGMPASPSPNPGGGWFFNFPGCGPDNTLSCSMNMVVAPVSLQMNTAQTITASIEIDTSGDVVWWGNLGAGNTCVNPASTRLYFQEAGDDWQGDGPYEFYRWFSSPDAYTLGAGSTTLSVKLDPALWSSVFGKFGTANVPAFQQALGNVSNIGFVFGGGCFHGHGVNITGGAAKFIAKSYTVQ